MVRVNSSGKLQKIWTVYQNTNSLFLSQMLPIGILLKYRENLSSSLIASEGFPCDYLDHPNTFWEALDDDYGNQAKSDNK